jgi:hypothetical protein
MTVDLVAVNLENVDLAGNLAILAMLPVMAVPMARVRVRKRAFRVGRTAVLRQNPWT